MNLERDEAVPDVGVGQGLGFFPDLFELVLVADDWREFFGFFVPGDAEAGGNGRLVFVGHE